MKIILYPEDVEKDGKEFIYRCQCGDMLRSDTHTQCLTCNTEYKWPETPGSKRLEKIAKNKASDLKAKDRERKLSIAASYVTMLAKMGEPNPDSVFIKTYLSDGEQALKATGQHVLSELGWIDSIDSKVCQEKAMELHQAGDNGRGLIVHLVNWISKTGGSVKPQVASQGNPGIEVI